MPFNGFANTEQLCLLREALEAHCSRHGISIKEEREDVASMVMLLYTRGANSVEEITSGLERLAEPGSEPRRRLRTSGSRPSG